MQHVGAAEGDQELAHRPRPDAGNALPHALLKGLVRVVARSALSGLIEGVEERQAKGFCVGVQWHPEKLGGRQPAIFSAHAIAARHFAASRAKGSASGERSHWLMASALLMAGVACSIARWGGQR